MGAEQAPRRRTARVFQLGVVLLAIVVILVVAIHTSPVRRAVLRRALATIQERLNIDLRADTLDYNLLALRVTLTGVSAARPGHETPFFTARRVRISVPTSAVFGPFALEDVTIDDARVRIVRRADGTTNLPDTGPDTGEEPAPLPVQHLGVARMSVEIEDASSSVLLAMPAVELVLERSDGHIRLTSPARLTRGSHSTRITELNGPVSFDGRTLVFGGLRLAAPEMSLSAKGRLALLVREPSVDLELTGRGDVAELARWALDHGDLPQGHVALDARVAGELSSPIVTTRLNSRQLKWLAITLTDLTADARLASDVLQVTRAEFSLAGGRVVGEGKRFIEADDSTVFARWNDIDAGALVGALVPGQRVRPSGRASGEVAARGRGLDLSQWEIDVLNRLRGGATSRDRLAVAGDASLRLAEGRWRLAGTHVVGGASIRADAHGVVNWNRIDASTLQGELDVTSADAPAFLRTLRSAGLVEIDEIVNRGAIRANARLTGSLGSPSLAFELAATDVNAAGVVAPLIEASGTARPAVGAYRVAVDARDATMTPTDDLPLGATGDFRFEAAGTPDGPAGRGSLTLRDVRYDRLAIGAVAGDIELSPRGAQVRATIPNFNARADAHVSLSAPHDARVVLTVEKADLQRLVRDFELPSPIAGSISLTAHANGPLDEPRRIRALLDVRELDARAGDLPIRLLAPGRVTYANDIISVDVFEASAGNTHISAAGQLPVSNKSSVAEAHTLRATVTGDLGEAVSAFAATGLVAVPAVAGQGPVALLARVAGSIETPRVSADLELGPGSLTVQDLPPFAGVQLRAHLEDDWIDLRQAEASWQGAHLTATGRAPVREGASSRPYHLEGRATGITAAVLEPFLEADTLSQLMGSIDASLQLESPSPQLAEARGELRLDRFDVRVANLPIVQQQPTRILIQQGFARVASWQWAGQGASLDVSGQVRLSDRQAALLADGQIDLRTLTPFVRDAGVTTAGRLAPRVSITGTLDNPRIDGDATLTAGEIRLVDPRVIVSDLAGRILLSRTRAQIASLTGSINGGQLTVSGQAEFGPDDPAAARVTADARGVAMEFPEGLRSELDASLAFDVNTGDEVEPPSGALTGTVTVLRGGYREPIAVAAGLLAALRADTLAPAPVEDSLLNRLSLDVRVLTDDDLIVDNNIGQLALGVDVRVIGTAAQPLLAGRAMVREGGQLFLGRNIYTIETGTIDFANPVTIEPDVNIVAHTRAGGEEITLTLRGTPETLEPQLESSTRPELGQADLASLLLTGRLLEEVTGDEAEILGEQVVGYLSGDVLGLASRAVGLDTIRLGGLEQTSLRGDPISIATETDPTARLTFGKSIGRNLDVTFSQSLRDGDAQTWIVEYLPRRQLETRLVSRDDDLRSYEFRHDVSFGGGLTTAPARVQPRRREPRVSVVSFRGTLVVPDERLRDVLELEAGDRFDFSEWQRDRDRLQRLYHEQGRLEARVASQRSEREGHIELSYEIDVGPATRIDVTGYGLDASTRARIETAWAQSVFDDFLVEEVEGIVRDALAREAYLHPTVVATLRSDADGAKTLTIVIETGQRTRDRRVRLEVDDPALRRDIDEWAERRAWFDIAWNDPRPAERELTMYLRARGFLQARVTVGAPVQEGSSATLPVGITPGPVYTVARVEFVNASGVEVTRLREAAGIAVGSVFDPAMVDAARPRVTTLYRRAGFASARVTARPRVDERSHGVSVVFDIQEGPAQVLSEVSVQGNRAIDTDVITRSLGVDVGEPIGADAWLRARKRLFDTGLFRRVDVAAEPIAAVDDDGLVQPMRARVTVQEWPTLRLRYGFELAEERPEGEIEGRNLVPGFSADLTRRTLFGRAVSLGASVGYQQRQRLARAFVSAPTMLGLPIESSLALERSREDFAAVTLITDVSKISWEQRFRFVRALQLSYSYRFERNHTFDTKPANPTDPIPPFDLTVNVARLISAMAWDTRDDPADSTRGTLLTSTFEYAPEALGSEFRFLRYLAQARHFRPWRQLVFASAVQLGLAEGLGGQDVIPSERFFAGGARSVRGAAEESLGPRRFGRASGGNALLQINQEVRVPLYRWLRGVGFIDAANVFATPSAIALGDLTGSVGLGLRLTTPFALLRVDYGRLLSPGPGERSGRWYFGIGQVF